ncbi:MAG: hypothetical protein KatS3mg111_3314 [Pirellulaceae bacterium]|nr:MAG: hypothetical protein KatS3mg111_3314 [Pirellulaceae bacterium]
MDATRDVTYRSTNPLRPQLLVSVQSVSEAQLAMSAGVSWIDLKNPAIGALGSPTAEVAGKVAALLHQWPSRSVAAGELVEADRARWRSLARLFPVIKLGLQHTIDTPWPETLDEACRLVADAGATLVPAAYADCERCAAPTWEEVLRYCIHRALPYLLIDTAIKDGGSLLDWLSYAELQELTRRATLAGIGVVLAGNLSLESLPRLATLPVMALGVRGAACQGARSGNIDAEKLRKLVAVLDAQPLPAGANPLEREA